MNAVFCRSYRSSDALWWLQRRTALWLLLFPCCLTASVLRRFALQRRVTGVGVVGVLTQRAGPGAEDEPRSREEGTSQQGESTAGAAETRLHGVPVLTLICHLALVNTYVFSAGIAVLCIQGLVAGAAVRSTLSHDVTLTAQRSLALKTTEVLHVPVSPFCLCTFICQNNLIAGLAAGLEPLSVVPAAVDLSVLEEVNQIDEQLAAGGTLETLRVPTAAVSCPTGKHRYVSTADLSTTLLADGSRHSYWEESDDASAQVFSFPLLTEQTQLLLLLLVQRVTVLGLTVVGWQLVQQLFDSVSLPWTVHIRHPVLWQAAKILVDLFRLEPRWDPCVLL